MSNACTGTYKALSRRDIKALERQTGLSVPPDMTEYYLKQNGGLPERPCWHYQDWDLFCLSRLIPIRPADAVEADFPNRCAIQDVVADVQPGIHLPAGFLPFGEDWGSNFLWWDPAGSGL